MSIHSNQHIDDQELISRFRKDGNNEWLGILLQRYTLLLYGVCLKYLKQEEEAKDAVQQVFIKALDELQKYPVSYVKSWLYMIAKNHCLMKLRNKNGKTTDWDDRYLAEPDETFDRDEMMQKERNVELLAKAMQELNDDQRLCITLFYLEKKSYQDIVEISGFSLMQVKSHLQNGKRNLKIQLERMQNNER